MFNGFGEVGSPPKRSRAGRRRKRGATLRRTRRSASASPINCCRSSPWGGAERSGRCRCRGTPNQCGDHPAVSGREDRNRRAPARRRRSARRRARDGTTNAAPERSGALGPPRARARGSGEATPKRKCDRTMTEVAKNVAVFGDHEPNTLAQLHDVASRAERAALMADGHLGYVMPIGGVAAYMEKVSVVGVGFDIACGNAAIRTEPDADGTPGPGRAAAGARRRDSGRRLVRRRPQEPRGRCPGRPPAVPERCLECAAGPRA